MMDSPNLFAAWEQDSHEILAAKLPWHKLSGQRILVTGAGGFIGGYIVRTLLSLNKSGLLSAPLTVVAMVRDVERARSSFSNEIDPVSLEFFEWNLNTIAIPPVGDVNSIIHAASLASRAQYDADPVGTLLPNAIGTAALLEHFRHCKEPRAFLFVSSSEVYGASGLQNPLSEDFFGVLDPIQTRSFYGESKRFGESSCAAYARQFGLPTYIARLFHTYGPGLKPDDGRVFADFVFKTIQGENITIESQGDAVRAFCYVTDAVKGLFYILFNGTPATPYNVGNREAALSVADLASLIVELSDDKQQGVTYKNSSVGKSQPSSDRNVVLPDTDRLKGLGWSPEIPPETGFKRMIVASS